MSDEVLAEIRRELLEFADPTKAGLLGRFFKTGPGQYGEGDIFLGVKVPSTRIVAGRHKHEDLSVVEALLHSKYHEERLCAVFILVGQYKRSKSDAQRAELFNFYLGMLAAGRINNWDLIDSSAPYLGQWLIGRADALPLLRDLSTSEQLWQRRASIMFTAPFIRAGQFEPTLEICTRLLGDGHDLIHKATGWMLREVGKRDVNVLRDYLEAHVRQMPRTMLRYAIEKLPETERKSWLAR